MAEGDTDDNKAISRLRLALVVIKGIMFQKLSEKSSKIQKTMTLMGQMKQKKRKMWPQAHMSQTPELVEYQ